MKIYLASRFDDRAEIKKMYAKLRSLGHEITADWTSHNPIARYGDDPKLAREYAIEDLAGVKEADVFIFITGPTVGTGSHTELGAAISQFSHTGRPKVYIVGEYNTRSIMYFHPAVTRRPSFEAVLDELGR